MYGFNQGTRIGNVMVINTENNVLEYSLTLLDFRSGLDP